MIISYKFRAECLTDIVRLLAILPDFDIQVISVFIEPISVKWTKLPDRVCTLDLHPVNHSRIIEAIEQVPDNHVMAETLNYTNYYTGERRVPHEMVR